MNSFLLILINYSSPNLREICSFIARLSAYTGTIIQFFAILRLIYS